MDSQASSSKDRPLRIAIAGGGIGGLALALGLTNQMKAGANLEYQIFEAAPQFKEIGAGVGVGPNANRALQLLGLGDDYAKLVEGTHKPNGIYFVWRWGEKSQIAKHGGEEYIGHTPCNHPVGHTTVHRAHFLDLMINKLPEGVAKFDKRLTRYTAAQTTGEDSYPIKLEFADGTTYEADVLVAMDGIKSAVRPILLQDDLPPEKLKPRFTGTCAYRGLVPMDKAIAKIGDKALQSTMYLGKDKHILTFPLQGGKVLNIVVFASDRSTADPVWDKEQWIVPNETPEQEMWQDWDDWSDDTKSLLHSLGKPDKWALHELYDLPTHVKGRVCLTGDSAAATLPHQGQGAAMAIESGYTLSTLLALPEITYKNAPIALQAFNEVRYARTTGVKNTSNEAGRVYEFAHSDTLDSKEAICDNLRNRYEWIWSWDSEGDLERGKTFIRSRI